MALTSTIYTFEIDLADADRGVYETLSLRIAKHPSESDEYLVARLFAYCLEHTEGIEFSRGLSDADDPAIFVRDLTGRVTAWIEVGAPAADRLHRASKQGPRVAVYTARDPAQWLNGLSGERIHRADALELYRFDRGFVTAFIARLDRRMSFALSVSDRELFVSLADETLSGRVDALAIPA